MALAHFMHVFNVNSAIHSYVPIIELQNPSKEDPKEHLQGTEKLLFF